MTPEKRKFNVNTILLLGFFISKSHIQTGPAQTKAVRDWPQPTSVKQLECFLGFAYFYGWFIWGLSTVATLHTALTNCWLTRCTRATEAGFSLSSSISSALPQVWLLGNKHSSSSWRQMPPI